MAKLDDFDDFEDYESQEESQEEDTGSKKIISTIIIIVVSIVLGIVVYKVSDILINDRKPPQNEEFIGEEIKLDDENVQILYQYVTYGTEGTRNLKFVKNREVTINSFSEEEKLYYALQFAQGEDFEFTGEYDEKKNKIYVFPNSTLNTYMKLFFGPNVQYQSVNKMSYPFTFTINKMNLGEMTYNSARGGYDTTFASYQEIKNNNLVDPVYGELISALRRPDGSIVLQERVVYTELRTDNGGYAVNVYKDPDKTVLLDTKTGLNDSNLSSFTLDLSSYQSTAIVEYVFGVSNLQCYFEGSRIIL